MSVGHSDHTEREAKLSAPAAYRPPNLDDIVDDLVAVPRPGRELRATYYDTRDLTFGPGWHHGALSHGR